MIVLLVGYNLTDNERTTLDKIGKYLSKDFKIIDLMSYELVSTVYDVVIVFGGKAARQATKASYLFKEEFPEPYHLSAGSGNEEDRKASAVRLKEIKHKLSLPITDQIKVDDKKYIIQESDLPNLTVTDILGQLKNIMVKQEAREWLGWTKNGKTVRLTVEPEDGKADINLTFAELFTLRTAMDALHLSEVEIVPRSSTNPNKNNSA